MDATGVRVFGSRIGPSAEAKTDERIGGFDIIKCAGLDEAIAVAAKHPMAAYGSIEVRALY